MRYHFLKESVQRNLLVADSQRKHLEFAKFDILFLPGAKFQDAYIFTPWTNHFQKILFSSVETNNLKVENFQS